ncbi:hydantoinase subunit beta [Enterococcus sp. JM4C]|uniref:hydantoinase/oxoprolinase N-terminal domain-containing protein n=1 Tax=Candidatus Enterococcus huntleyi TaxID=1857217 RepID=UPI001379BA85|nr:hydantoinase/oxoprolinase family protein [Enterococcus sp. JM4C]KAF1299535.1 hydantoinase subunit beta [Enterococcus sp. JM4C]
MYYRLGIDVGGTNTDCAILDENLHCIGKIKSPTMADVSQGIDEAIKKILQVTQISTDKINAVMLGTTHCTNAIVQRKDLSKVGIIRLAKPATTAVAPMVGWPEDLAAKMSAQSAIVAGGYEYNGNLIAEIDETEIRSVCQQMKGQVEAVAVVGVFSPVNKEQEIKVAAIVREELNVPVTLSSEIGSIGLLERENASILNAALTQTIKQMINGLRQALHNNNLSADVFICQNDGTLMDLEKALQYPVLTIGCGPTNSIRGAAHLSKQENALVVDVGGTTTDIGVLKNSFPRESSLATIIGGIRTNFRMPDVLSIGLGGGTIIHLEEELRVGPDSLGYRILEESRSFGGTVLCATDIAIANQAEHPVTGATAQTLDPELIRRSKEKIKELVEDAIDQMKTDSNEIPVILVGGGSIILPTEMNGVSEVIIPENYDAANAIGAALGEVSGEVNSVYSLEDQSQEEVVAMAIKEAREEAIAAGAIEDDLKTIFVEVIPIAYLPKQAANIKVKVAGKLQLGTA